uniref:Predicted protein n=1 Tax=Hordeum vulgare subsp. vulgare TaxID=112509 RepID=F2ECV2_HORVV|nr:predicted protein [Hordeum vulgare subsp. vulgare]
MLPAKNIMLAASLVMDVLLQSLDAVPISWTPQQCRFPGHTRAGYLLGGTVVATWNRILLDGIML